MARARCPISAFVSSPETATACCVSTAFDGSILFAIQFCPIILPAAQLPLTGKVTHFPTDYLFCVFLERFQWGLSLDFGRADDVCVEPGGLLASAIGTQAAGKAPLGTGDQLAFNGMAWPVNVPPIMRTTDVRSSGLTFLCRYHFCIV